MKARHKWITIHISYMRLSAFVFLALFAYAQTGTKSGLQDIGKAYKNEAQQAAMYASCVLCCETRQDTWP